MIEMRPFQVLQVVEDLVTTPPPPRTVDTGPCDPVLWIHRWTDYQATEVLGDVFFVSRECTDCEVVEGWLELGQIA